MPREFQNIFDLAVSLDQVIASLIVACISGLLIATLYRLVYRGPGYSVAFVNALVILCMITAIVIMVIGNNLARAFGLVGAMSIIRFRTAVKDTQDIIFIFFALAIGMASGVGLYAVAITGVLLIGTVYFGLVKTHIAAPQRREFLLQFDVTTNGATTDAPYQTVLNDYCRHNQLINVKTNGAEDSLELAYYVRLRSGKSNRDFVRDLKKSKGVGQVNLFYDEEQF